MLSRSFLMTTNAKQLIYARDLWFYFT